MLERTQRTALAEAEQHTVTPIPKQATVEALIDLNYDGLLSLTRCKLRDPELAADLVNQAIIIALEHARSGRLNRGELIAGYVFKVTMNLMRNHRRSFDNRPHRDVDADSIAVEGKDTHEPAQHASVKQLVQRLLEALDGQRDRLVITRFYLLEESKDSICVDLGLSPLHFNQVLSRARRRLKVLLESSGLQRSDLLCL